jgi:hypothetical protein
MKHKEIWREGVDWMNWHIIRTSDEPLWAWWWAFGFHKIQWISWLAEWLLASQELFSMELVSYICRWTFSNGVDNQCQFDTSGYMLLITIPSWEKCEVSHMYVQEKWMIMTFQSVDCPKENSKQKLYLIQKIGIKYSSVNEIRGTSLWIINYKYLAVCVQYCST